MINLTIGTVVDFIALRARFRGLVLDIRNGMASVGVLGYSAPFNLPLDSLVPVTAMEDVLPVFATK